jgi:MinD-like ATPase involved in chromosome partitioning or flagellar assembly
MTAGSSSALVDGLPVRQGALARARRKAQRLAVSPAEREEAEVERQLLAHPGVTRANAVAVMSPTGGVGKTACAFVIGTVLATHLKLRTVAVEVGPGFGTLGQLVPARRRAGRGVRHLLGDADRLFTAAELSPYVSRLASGLHVLAAGQDARMDTDECGELLALLSCFYEAIVLDLGTGVVTPLAAMAAMRADQIVLVTTPDHMTSSATLHARAHLRRPERTIVAINRAHRDSRGDERPYSAVTIPHDDQLGVMLTTGTYTLGALEPPTRRAIKRLGLAVAEQLV